MKTFKEVLTSGVWGETVRLRQAHFGWGTQEDDPDSGTAKAKRSVNKGINLKNSKQPEIEMKGQELGKTGSFPVL